MIIVWLETLKTPLIYGVVCTALALTLFAQWRVLLPALFLHYMGISLVLGSAWPLPLAFGKLVVGTFMTLILYVTMRQVADERLEPPVPRWAVWSAAVLLLIGAWALAQLAASPLDRFLIYALSALGVCRFLTTTAPLHAGLGVLLILTGVEYLYLLTNPSAWLLSFGAIAHLLVTLVLVYLAQTNRALSSPPTMLQ